LRRAILLCFAVLFCTMTVHAQTTPPRVVASFSILADVAQNVAGSAAAVTSLMPFGADPHSFSPRPGDLIQLADANVVFISGAQLEEGLNEVISNAGSDMNVVVASQCVEILPFNSAAEAITETAPADPVGQRCAAYAAELDSLHRVSGVSREAGSVQPLGRLYTLACTGGDQGSCDPHVWYNPANVELWTLQIRDTLSQLDPANAPVYAQNASAYLGQLETLRADLAAQIASLPPERRVLVTNHDALAYFADTYGFKIVGLVIPSVSTLSEPSAKQVAQLIDTIRTQNAPAVFAENTVSPNLAQQVADEAGAQFYELYTDSLSAADGPAPTYLDFMRYNVQIIVAALK
jgi:manganese/iron transport system substrate-binding protein